MRRTMAKTRGRRMKNEEEEEEEEEDQQQQQQGKRVEGILFPPAACRKCPKEFAAAANLIASGAAAEL